MKSREETERIESCVALLSSRSSRDRVSIESEERIEVEEKSNRRRESNRIVFVLRGGEVRVRVRKVEEGELNMQSLSLFRENTSLRSEERVKRRVEEERVKRRVEEGRQLRDESKRRVEERGRGRGVVLLSSFVEFSKFSGRVRSSLSSSKAEFSKFS